MGEKRTETSLAVDRDKPVSPCAPMCDIQYEGQIFLKCCATHLTPIFSQQGEKKVMGENELST